MAVLAPKWPTDRLKRGKPSLNDPCRPLVTYEKAQNALRLDAVDGNAENLGLFKGQALTDARAMCPHIIPVEARRQEDAKAFTKLCEGLIRYSPIVSIEGVGEAFIDITGCEKLFGGEENIFGDITDRLKKSGVESCIAIADTAGAAWGLARYGKGGALSPGATKAGLATLPIEALRLDAPVAEGVRRLGLKRIGQLYDMPRAPLTARFTKHLLTRLGQALGAEPEPLTPLRPAPHHYADLKLAEPIAHLDAVFECLKRLCDELSVKLFKAGKGGRRFELTLFRVDNEIARIAVGTSQPARESAHIQRLFKDRLDDLGGDYDAGFGFEQFRLGAFETGGVAQHQHAAFDQNFTDEGLAELKDRLSNRLGARHVCHLRLNTTHLPERADHFEPVMQSFSSPAAINDDRIRPIKLLPQPEEIEALAQVPDGPPIRFKWRRVSYRVAKASGPERIGDEWWRQEMQKPTRDYYRIEDENGRRFWIFRDGLYERETAEPKWFLHGFFA